MMAFMVALTSIQRCNVKVQLMLGGLAYDSDCFHLSR